MAIRIRECTKCRRTTCKKDMFEQVYGCIKTTQKLYFVCHGLEVNKE